MFAIYQDLLSDLAFGTDEMQHSLLSYLCFMDIPRERDRPKWMVPCLRCDEKHALLFVRVPPYADGHLARHYHRLQIGEGESQTFPRLCMIDIAHLDLRDSHDVEAGLNLLLDERLRRRHEDDLGEGEPAEVVVHDHGRDEGLAQPRRQRHQRVVVQAALHNSKTRSTSASANSGQVPCASTRSAIGSDQDKSLLHTSSLN